MGNIYSAYQHQGRNFQPEKVKQYDFRVFLRKNLIQYAVLSPEGKILAVKDYRATTPMDFPEFFDEVYAQDYFLKEDYRSVQVHVGTMQFSLIPTKNFQPAQVKAFAGTMLRESSVADVLDYQNMEETGATAIFTSPSSMKLKCDHYFGEPDYVPFCIPAIRMASSLSVSHQDMVWISVVENQVLITGYSGGKLHACNAYDFREVTDIVFYAQLIMDFMKLDATKAKVVVSGDFEMDSELMRLMQKYMPRLEVPVGLLRDAFDTQSDKLPVWKYAHLAY